MIDTIIKQPVLVVEDDSSLSQMIQSMLELEGYQVKTVASGREAISSFEKTIPEVVLLDIGLPDMNGIEVCKTIRRFSNVPILMVTGNAETQQKVEGLNSGADDYITKPFSYSELIARISVALRHSKNSQPGSSVPFFKCGDLVIDFNKQSVSINNQIVDLSNTEYRILAFLAQQNGRIVGPTELLKEIWGDDQAESIHLLQVNISRLRQKLNDNAYEGRYIGTRSGQGYSLVVENTQV
jgi:two-component system KDP operon response regulator KdpE